MSTKKNHKPIPFMLALKTCSKGSHQKVIWECPECKVSGIRLFKSAIKITLCKSCNSRSQIATFDIKGEKNPWYGKIPPCIKSGDKNPNWNPNISDAERTRKRLQRKHTHPEYETWRRAVLARDGFCCRKCKTSKAPFNAHHINNWFKFPEQRFDLANGITLCYNCHKTVHSTYGRYTTKEATQEFFVD